MKCRHFQSRRSGRREQPPSRRAPTEPDRDPYSRYCRKHRQRPGSKYCRPANCGAGIVQSGTTTEDQTGRGNVGDDETCARQLLDRRFTRTELEEQSRQRGIDDESIEPAKRLGRLFCDTRGDVTDHDLGRRTAATDRRCQPLGISILDDWKGDGACLADLHQDWKGLLEPDRHIADIAEYERQAGQHEQPAHDLFDSAEMAAKADKKAP